ncbi:accessory Sec system protein Asp2 [Arthrobacter sp. Z1-15]
MKHISPKKIHVHNGIEVEYKTQAPRQDRRHLVVVFSGFCPIGKYNFDGTVADGCRFGILWINDVFDGDNCYYLCSGMNFSVEAAVVSLINDELERLGLTKDECTLFGYSKGGSAALYFGLKYNFSKILASAPQMHIGSFTKVNFPSSYSHMIGPTDSVQSTTLLDRLLPDELQNDQNLYKNIYLISSLDDQFHQTEVVPYLHMWKKYKNFNLIMTSSELVREHKTVGQYNTPIILSILYALGEGSILSFEEARTGQKEHYASKASERVDSSSSGEWIVTCDSIGLAGNRLFLDGAALLEGVPQTKYDDKAIDLIFSTSEEEHRSPLGSYIDESKSNQFYKGGFCDYRAAGFKTMHGNGIDLLDLKPGSYQLSLSILINGVKTHVPVAASKQVSARGFCDGYYYSLQVDSSSAILAKRPHLGAQDSPQSVSFVDRFAFVNSRLHVEGCFAILGVDYSRYDNGLFSLVIQSRSNTYRFALGQGNRSNLSQLVDGGFGDYSKAYFATPGYLGINLSNVALGRYTVFISTYIGPTVFTMEIEHQYVLVSTEGVSVIAH